MSEILQTPEQQPDKDFEETQLKLGALGLYSALDDTPDSPVHKDNYWIGLSED